MGWLNLPRILIITAVRNEEHSLRLYLKSLHDLKYPKNLIDLYWLENDSTDHTLEILEKAKHCATLPYAMLFGFNSVTLEKTTILGPVKKGKPGAYVKDIPYGPGRHESWFVIWDNYFLPLARTSSADYVVWTCADCIAPPNVISEYLKVYALKKDAGWVAGAIYRRYPYHKKVRCPMPFKFVNSKEIVEVDYVGHWIMMPRAALAKAKFWVADDELARAGGGDIHMSLVKSFRDQGLKVYYQPSVFLKHISTDGKIHTHEIISGKWPYMKKHVPWLASIELTNRCNARCVYCGKQHSPRKDSDMPFELYKSIVDSPFLKQIHPEIIGEPLLYPEFVEAVAYAKKKGKRVLMYTNASLLNPKMAGRLLNAGVDEIRFSVDACDPETFESLRPGLSWKTVLSNIETFQQLKRKGHYHTITVVRATITKENEARIDKIKSFWRKRVDAFISFREVNIPLPSLINQRKWTSGTPIKECARVHHLTVKSNGDVVLCCRDWYGLYVMGNIKNSNVLDIFNSEKFNRVRAAMEQGKNYPTLCDYCRQPPTRISTR